VVQKNTELPKGDSIDFFFKLHYRLLEQKYSSIELKKRV